jgi:hypothetical protein
VKETTVRRTEVSVCKVSKRLGLVFGYAIVCKVRNADGKLEDYYDSGSIDPDDGKAYSDHIPEDVMLESASDFMKSQRVATEDHERELDDDGNLVLDENGHSIPVAKGSVIHSMPLTEELAEFLGVQDTVRMTGWVVAMQPEAEVFKKFESGELKQFSIGGRTIRQKANV